MKDLRLLLSDTLDVRLFTLGGHDFTLGSLVVALTAFIALLIFVRWLRRWMVVRLQKRGHFEYNTLQTISALTQYVVLIIGVVSILNAVGISLSSFTVLAGAFGVGVGFGLQNIFSNFISGLIVMFERPVKVGDHVVIAGVEGDVISIGMRATTIQTAQGSAVLVPNQAIITTNVVNWDKLGRSTIALQFRMTGSIEENKALLLRVVGNNAAVMKTPEPKVYVASIDHGGQTMEVHFHVQGDAAQRLTAVSEINEGLSSELARLKQNLAP